MASAAMDSAGNIAMGYNVSSGQMFPRISFTGRRATDPLGQLTLGEGDVIVGAGSQTHSSSRWGDYSLLAVDPIDGCTFWFTTEYLANTTSSGWRTRVGAFQIEGCSGGGGGGDPVAAPTNLVAASITATQVALSWSDNADDETNYHVERCQGGGCSQFSEIAQIGANAATYTDTPSANTYGYRVRASRNGTFSAYSNAVAAVMPPGAPTNLTATAVSPSRINLAWTDSSSNEANFHVDRCEGSGCLNFVQIASLPAGSSSYANIDLAASTTFTYRVRATNVTASTPSTAAEATTHAPSTATHTHVGNLTGTGVKVSGPNWQASVTIQVHDNNGNAVSNAAVTGTWSSGFTGTAACTTAANGTCVISTGNVHNRVASVTFTVGNIAGDLGDRHETMTFEGPGISCRTGHDPRLLGASVLHKVEDRRFGVA
jgi:hypothetical protein